MFIRTIQSVRAVIALLMVTFLLMFSVQQTHAQGGSNLPLISPTQFSELTFSTTPIGLSMSYYPPTTTRVYARFNYANATPGLDITFEWIHNGVSIGTDLRRWPPEWGTTGYLTEFSIAPMSIGGNPERLPAGNWLVKITMWNAETNPAAVVIGDFVVGEASPVVVATPASNGVPTFSDLTVSTSAGGAAMTTLPAGTPSVSARWNYGNIPIGVEVTRTWMLNGQIYRQVSEPWSAYWGNHGRLTHVSLYDYQFGLPSGQWQLIVSLSNGLRAEVAWVIADRVTPAGAAFFQAMTFSTSPNGEAAYLFPRGTQQIFARWGFQNVPAGSTVRRTWYLNGVVWLVREEPWGFGTNGTVNSISIYDFITALPQGTYFVVVELLGMPNARAQSGFVIQ